MAEERVRRRSRSRAAAQTARTGRSPEVGAIDGRGAGVLERVLTGASEVTVSTGAGRSTTVTGALLEVMRSVASALDRGESVIVSGQGVETVVISSQEAADLLNVSRPYVVKLARSGQLRYHMVGNRHRFARADVLAYAARMRDERSEALAAMAPPTGYTTDDF